MVYPAKDQLKYWGIATLVFVSLLWVLGDVLLPFVVGSTIAYLVDPMADRLERAGLSRVAATAVITFLAILVFVVVLLLVVPTLVSQTIGLIKIMPQVMRDLQAFLIQTFPSMLDESSTLRKTLISIGETIQDQGGEVLNSVIDSAMKVVNVVVFFVVVPVVTIYMLLDWDRMIERIDSLLPRDHAPVIRRLAGEIDETLASFIRGMGTVCLILGTYYAVALMLVGLQFGLVVGFIAGLVTFIPYLGALIGGTLAIGLALFQYWGDWGSIGLVVIVFVVGQVVEGNFLTPRLVGKSVGLHPVWLLLALSVFGALFGFLGLLIAVPMAAAMGVLTRFGLEQYLSSPLYKGVSTSGDADQDTP